MGRSGHARHQDDSLALITQGITVVGDSDRRQRRSLLDAFRVVYAQQLPQSAPGLNPTSVRASPAFAQYRWPRGVSATRLQHTLNTRDIDAASHPVSFPTAYSSILGVASTLNVSFARPVAGAARGLSNASVTRLQNTSGYSTPIFTGKSAQRSAVEAAVALKGFVPAELVPLEVACFYDQLGIDDTYFANESSDEIYPTRSATTSSHSAAPM